MIDKTHQLVAVKSRFAAGYPVEIRCDRGWYQLIIDCDLELAAIDPDYEVFQIKEKFGTLRFYFSPSKGMEHFRRKMNEIVGVYESVSSYKCELCGQMGATLKRNSGRFKTTCKLCTGD